MGMGVLLKKISPKLYNILIPKIRKYSVLHQIRNDITISEKVCEDKEEIQYIVLNGHVGEAVRVMRALGEFRKFYSEDNIKPEFADGTLRNNKVIDKIIVITTRRKAAVARLWNNADEVIELPEHEVMAIQRYSEYTFGYKNILLPFRDFKNSYYFRLYGLSSMDIGWALQIPPYKEKIIPCKYGEWTINQGKKMIKKYGIKKNEAVILIPSALTCPNFPDVFWKKLISKFINKGKTVFVNCSTKQDQKIADCGAITIDFPMDVFLYFCEYAGKVISNQSGLGDLVVWSGRNISCDMLIYDETGNEMAHNYIMNYLGETVKKKQYNESTRYFAINDMDISDDRIYQEFL